MRERDALFCRIGVWVATLIWLLGSSLIGQRQFDELRSRVDSHAERMAQTTEHLSAVEARVKTIEDMDLASRLARIETYLLGIFVPVFLMGLETVLRLGGRLLALKLTRS